MLTGVRKTRAYQITWEIGGGIRWGQITVNLKEHRRSVQFLQHSDYLKSLTAHHTQFLCKQIYEFR